MKRNSVVFACFMMMLYVVLSSDIDGPAHHGHGDITGAPTGVTGHCQTSSCHGTNNTHNVVALQVLDTTSMLPVTTYNPNQTYLVKLTGDATTAGTNLPGFGFQVSAVLGNKTLAGSYTIPTAINHNIHTFACGATTVVEQSVTLTQDTVGVNKYSIEFYWTAPAPLSDSVSFYSLLNAVNGDGGKPGDYPNAARKVTIYENTVNYVAPLTELANPLSLYPNPATTTLTVSAATVVNSIVITDLSGHVIYRNYYSASQVNISVSALPAGAYFINVNGKEVRKFVKE